jgi:hypothetical protein
LQIKREYRSLAGRGAHGFDFDDAGDAEPGELADALASKERTTLRCALAVCHSAVSPNIEVSVLALGEGHACAVIPNDQLGRRAIIGRQDYVDLSRVGIPRVCD